jgi:HEPN domain-containing protein
MSADPVLVAETKAWLRKAALDLHAAEHDLTASPPLFADAVFHCQQVAEKSLKALLMWHNTPFRKTHSLEEIGEQCLDLDQTLKGLIDKAVPLTEYAWKFRYPGDPEEPSHEEALEALDIARKVFEAIISRLPEEVRPEED